MALPAWGIALVVVNFLFWGHWPICAKMAGAPPQPFGVVMVLTQTGCAFLACFASGDQFFAALAADSHASPTAVFCVLLGGAALAIGDFSAAAAVERLGLAVGGPVCFSCMLICGAIGDFLLEGSAHPLLLFGGVAGCGCAVVADSQSHPPKRRSSLASADGAQAVAAATEEGRLESEVERAIRVIKQAEGVATASPVPPTRLALADDGGGEEKEGVAGAGAPGGGTPGASEARRSLPTAPMSAVELEEGGRLPASSTGSSGQQADEASARAMARGDADRSEFRKSMAVAVVGGCIGGMCAEPHASAYALLPWRLVCCSRAGVPCLGAGGQCSPPSPRTRTPSTPWSSSSTSTWARRSASPQASRAFVAYSGSPRAPPPHPTPRSLHPPRAPSTHPALPPTHAPPAAAATPDRSPPPPALPVVLVYGRLFGGATRLGPLLRLIRGLRRRQAAWTAAAGLCIAVGYLCYFATRGVVPRAVAYAFGCIPMMRLEPQTCRPSQQQLCSRVPAPRCDRRGGLDGDGVRAGRLQRVQGREQKQEGATAARARPLPQLHRAHRALLLIF